MKHQQNSALERLLGLAARFSDLERQMERVEHKAERQLARFERHMRAVQRRLGDGRQPATDVHVRRRGDDVVIEWPLDGLGPDDVTVTLSDRLLEVHAAQGDGASGNIFLPFAIDAEAAAAVVDDGKLTITAPIAH